MEKNCIVNILLALVVICIKKCTSDDKLVEIHYLWQPKHWNDMTWFDKILEAPVKKNTRMDVEKHKLWTFTQISIVSKMKIIPILMQCGYGKQLIDYLWISAYTATQCGNLLNDGDGNAEDCWQKLDDSLKKGAVITYKLWAMNAQISKLDKRIIDDNRFYKMLLQIHNFLNRPQPCLSLMEPERLCGGIKALTTPLGNEWNKTCQPSYSVIGQEELQGEFESLPPNLNETPKLLYDFYVDRLNAKIDSIKKDTEKIGFQYKPPRKTVTFSVPTGIDGSSSSRQ